MRDARHNGVVVLLLDGLARGKGEGPHGPAVECPEESDVQFPPGMPSGQFDKPLVKGLEHNENWQLVFLNNRQKIFVDVTNDKGRKIFQEMTDT